MTTSELASKDLERVVRSLGDDALAEARARALQKFAARGFPTTRDEDWKYTDLTSVIDISERWLAAPDVPAADEAGIRRVQAAIDADWLVIANGRIERKLSTLQDLDGVELHPLDAGPETLRFPLSDLNVALLQDGATIRISDGFRAERPIGLLFFDSTSDAAVTSQARIDIDIAPHARATFIEFHGSGGDGEHYANVHLNMTINERASVDYLRLQDRDLAHSQTARLNVALAQDSSLHHSGIDLGSRMARNDLQVDLVGKGASATFDGLYIAGNGQHLDNHTRVDHRIGPAVSRQEYRGVLGGRSRAVWNGKAIVHKGADGTDAEQANHNLLLSDQAEIDAKPELEIYADEVKCAHGTTVGQLDEAALFYLRSRGIDRERAQRILTRAFAASIVAKSPITALHDWIGDKVERRLQQMAAGDAE